MAKKSTSIAVQPGAAGVATSFDGTQIHYQVFGPGPVTDGCLLYLACDKSQGAALGAQTTAIVVDRRGTGQSSGSASPYDYTVEAYGQDAVAVLDALGVGRAAVVAYSQAWADGVWLAINQPQRVSCLVLVEPASGVATSELEVRIAMVASGDVGGAVRRLVRQMDPSLSPSEVEATTSSILANYPNPGGMAGDWRARTQYPATAQLFAQITVPTLVVAGGESVNADENRRVAHSIPGATSRDVPGTTHLLPYESPDALVGAIVPFVSTNR